MRVDHIPGHQGVGRCWVGEGPFTAPPDISTGEAGVSACSVEAQAKELREVSRGRGGAALGRGGRRDMAVGWGEKAGSPK